MTPEQARLAGFNEAIEKAAKVADDEPEPEDDMPPEMELVSRVMIAKATCRVTKKNIAAAARAARQRAVNAYAASTA